MLCIGKRTNYDAPVLVQASGRPHPGRLTSMQQGDFTVADPSGVRSALDAPRSFMTMSDEPARRIRCLPFLLGYWPVFAW